MREELTNPPQTYGGFRITPACAGRTLILRYFCHFLRDHPRVCGKNVDLNLSLLFREGSPPRVREELISKVTTAIKEGITPACAGRTREDWFRCLCDKDHPRVCGKNAEAKIEALVSPGSPPRVREELVVYFLGNF